MDEERTRTSGKWSKFCPKCGKPTEEFFESLCEACFRAGLGLLEHIEVSLSVCAHCGGYFKGKEQTSIEAVAEEVVKKAIRKKHGYGCGVMIVGLRTEPGEEERRPRVVLTARAEISGLVIEKNVEVVVNLKRETCERCSRIAGGYYAGIVQVRAADRIPTDEELARAERIAYMSLDEEDFVSKVEVLKEGLDIYVSSMECGRRISREIVRRLGGSFSESRKLYGRRDGRAIYRVSFSVRLPRYQQGEAVALDDHVLTVERVIEGKGIEGVDTETGEHRFVSKKKLMRARKL